ncbi:type II secretion system protein N, partial [Candidatus Thioglobus sp.]|uniref:type II secretion system protein N n=1 Tax=Candidatus Thioglobus sp. TaxID=2026721 RepID=UPI0026184CE6
MKQQHDNIKSTRLNLTLIGILNQYQQSLAIIKQGSGKDKIYKINDFIDSSTLIKEIHAKYIILSRNGSFE